MSKQDAINMLKSKVQKLLLQADLLERLIPDNLPGQIWACDSEIRIDLPYDLALLKQSRRLLGDDWKMKHGWLNKEAGDRYIVYSHKSEKGVRLVICLDPLKSGSVCRRVQVGTVETPVYQVVCGEAVNG